ncbi:NACHT domain-containing protein [Streptomyces mirabilis]|uniref:NACHT domain-containing protein n=1 Tax=Streptomyces mirabilis TaxID=68239 RepID=UPI003680F46E
MIAYSEVESAPEGERVKILVIADEEKNRGDLFNERMKDIVHALGYEITRTNINKPGRELDIIAEHSLEDRRAVIECKAKKEKIGGGDVNKFVGAIDAERRPGESLVGYFVSISGFTDSALEQEAATGRRRVHLLGPDDIQEQLQRARIVVSREAAYFRAGSLGGSGWTLDNSPDLVAHECGWIWVIYFREAGERRGYTLVHADGNFPSRAMGQQVAQALTEYLDHPLTYIEGTPELSLEDIESAREAYFEYIASEYGDFTLEGFPVDQHLGSKSIALEELYIPQYLEEVIEADVIEGQSPSESTRRERYPLREILRSQRAITVLGAPGAGKSTLVKRLATSYADPQRRDRISDELPDVSRLPLVVKCREIRSENAAITELLFDISARAEMPSAGPAFTKLVSHALRDGSALILIDGLDEFSDSRGRAGFLRRLRAFMSRYPLCTVVVTSREAGFREVAGFVGKLFTQYRISELNNEEIKTLTLAWHKQVHGGSASVVERASRLAEQIIDTDRVRRLALNPLLLTTLLLVQRWVGDLPRKRSVLYEKAIELLLMTWNVEGYDPLDLDEAKPHLAYLAHTMTCSGQQQVRQQEMLEVFRQAREDLPEVLGYCKLGPQDLLKRIELRSSLVSQVGHALHNGTLQPTYEFKHLTFQEYLTATAISQGWHSSAPEDGQHLDAVKEHVLDPQWHEVIALYGVLAGRKGKALFELLCDRMEELIEAGEREPESPENDFLYDEITELAYLIYQCLDDEVQAPPPLADRALDLVIPHMEEMSLFDGIITSRYGDQLLAKARNEVDEAKLGDSRGIEILGRLFIVGLPQTIDQPYVESRLKEMLAGDDVHDRVGALGALFMFAYSPFGEHVTDDLESRGIDLEVGAEISRACLPEVLPFIGDTNAIVRYAALWVLAWTARSGDIDIQDREGLFMRLVEMYLRDPDMEVRRFAGWALVEVQDLFSAPILNFSPMELEEISARLDARADSHETKAAVFLGVLSRDAHLIRKATEYAEGAQHQTRFEKKILEFAAGAAG